jgi:hypothetical protein
MPSLGIARLRSGCGGRREDSQRRRRAEGVEGEEGRGEGENLPSSLFPLPSSFFLLPSSFFLLPSSFTKCFLPKPKSPVLFVIA